MISSRSVLSALFFLFTLLPSAMSEPAPGPEAFRLVDPRAQKRVKALYFNLQSMAGKGILFGHQDALAYGIHWKAEPGRSDVKEVCGDYPAVYGWDISKLGKYSYNIDSVDFGKMRQWIREAYERGGINTISWHLDNPVTGGGSWDTTAAVPAILPGGRHHDWYKSQLDHAAAFFKSLRAGGLFKHHIPVIFRPFHEHTGSWFWWGKGHCTPEEYKALWRFTVHYLRDVKQVHNLLYAYSTDIIESREQYLEFYPGDEYTDMLGIDDYHDVSKEERGADLTRRLNLVSTLAAERGKLSALTETGFSAIPDPNWWTDLLLRRMTADPAAGRISYVLVWRNARLDHHYAPFPGHGSAGNFVRFYQDERTLFNSDLPDLYRMPKQKP